MPGTGLGVGLGVAGLGVAGGGGGAVGGRVAGRCVGAVVGGIAGRGVAVCVGAGVDEGTGSGVSAAQRVGVRGMAVEVAVEVAVAIGSEGVAVAGDSIMGTGVGDETKAEGGTILVVIVREAVSWLGTGVGEPSAELFICVTPAATTSASTRAEVSTPPKARLGVACRDVEGPGTARGLVIGAVPIGRFVVGSRAKPHRAHANRPAFIGEWHRGHTWGESMKLQQPLLFRLRRYYAAAE